MTENKNKIYSLTASCAAGLETLVSQEVQTFGGTEIEEARGLVTWQGNLESAYRTCLWSRYASRIFLMLVEFPALDEEALYQGALTVDWAQQMRVGDSFAVDCSISQSAITHSRFAALRVKDALVDQFREQCGERPSVSVERPDLRIRLYIHKDQATLSLDLSGESLHRRGYRSDGGSLAPLKESLAAAIVTLAGWTPEIAQDTMLLDPMCGSGTLLIEGALIYGDAAPGLSRSYFGFNGWKEHDAALWSRLVEEAVQREEAGLDRDWPLILGYDADPRAVAVARKNIENAGLQDRIVIKQGQLAHLRRPAGKGILVVNPPYGERLAEKDEAEQLHRALGRICKRELDGWQLGVFTANPDFGDRMAIKWEETHRLYNGPISCRLFCGRAQAEDEQEFQWQMTGEQGPAEAEEFANRLRKNAKKILKWADREGIRCFRLYDRDLPHYNVSVDIYEKWILVQEYAAPESVDEKIAAERFQQSLVQIRHLFGVRRDRVFLKTRRKQKGKAQYQQQAKRKKMHVVREGDCFLLVNFTDYLDTGLFLDHRSIRARVGKEAAGKRFLNLYGYTGSATVHAAVGGAETTTTVDLSTNYLSWARANLSLNGFGGLAHETVTADCLQWLQENRGEYDLIFVDPPTFSNTKKQRLVFDVQRDHKVLLEKAMAHLAKDGLLIFSTNFRRFQMDESLTERFAMRNISRDSIPLDFARNSKIHQCWEIRRKQETGKQR
ncbi:MAG: bifunctional 23S rRNA (guanine(2069)-N(7))-methyltransferase RlmK/23S rRNA (guanine(2445)-N(2))-methyltransferase RlmL [Proteobacteria bacterium]|nr:bifunctional 23S rRNA (guanine(2069)-N(7))-methyltransferase RlmK/23S rRNA (guanine(2445)-N(2))-methyltransferase RlmL [Pseudomonadota bacterium]